jgi:rod shape-determining protein MreB and related proteins
MGMNLLGSRASGLGIDLGTVNTLICDQNSRILLNEPSIVTVNRRTEQIEAVGGEARRMLGRTPAHLEVVMPLRDGVINHFDLTQEMLRRFLRKIQTGPRLLGSNLVICVPTETTQIERRAVRETGISLKASEVYVVEEPMAAAIGVGLPIAEPRGSMVVDIGGGTTEIAVISFCGVVCSGSVRVAGNHMDEAVVQHIRRKYNMLIGYDTAERLKIELGCAAAEDAGKRKAQVKGRDLVSQLPRTLTVAAQDVYDAISDLLVLVVNSVRKTLERTPPELAADIAVYGIVLTGGGALLPGLDRRIQRETGLPVKVAANPLLSVAVGAARLLKEGQLLERIHIRNL